MPHVSERDLRRHAQETDASLACYVRTVGTRQILTCQSGSEILSSKFQAISDPVVISYSNSHTSYAPWSMTTDGDVGESEDSRVKGEERMLGEMSAHFTCENKKLR